MTQYDTEAYQTFKIFNHTFHLLPDKAVFWPALSTLIIADLHLGKAAHFNRAGISLPNKKLEQVNFDKLEKLMAEQRPKKVVFLGDLFHSAHNDAWNQFVNFTNQYTNTEFVLIIGNHDILNTENYEAAKLRLTPQWQIDGLLFTHEPEEYIADNVYNIAGHLHPGVRLVAPGQPSLRLPCFFFGAKQGILPAFGSFTGTMLMKPKKKDAVFIVYEDKVQKM